MLPIRKLLRDCRAATAIEYGLIVGFVVVILLIGLGNLGAAVRASWESTSNRVENAH